ncbi:fimbrial protein [Salmonella enterica subsp. enterica serovar Newport]|nr:fimbrial protein [Salmonella enterica subsp. enterica serovar Newport]EHS5152833.1 fimbrial protein [Salmonella enterica subsp. enterica serovar Newport]EHV5816203.1 fimbrial protein [Salmonella enterica subsp. enterica serovar Newport]EIC3608376.1 fimbrial protein [Salmonella enterica subsp. enterica serovar Newport]EJB3599260.1 fimbrial protein [Salmonella enterica subsp. enterica serovar Newport]
MNKVMYGENRRRGGRNTLCRLLRSGRWFLCLALHCSVMLPGFAGAADTKKECTDWSGNNTNISLNLPPSVSFEPGKLPAPGQVLYTSPAWYQVNYKCKTNSSGTVQPALTVLADANPLLQQALKDAGLKLQVLIDGVGTPWQPATQDSVSFGPSYNRDKDTGEQTLRLKAQLIVERKPSPGFYAVPALTAFKLISSSGYIATPGLFLVTTSVRIQYVPACFVKTSVPPFVNFGPVMTTDVSGSFYREIGFDVRAQVNSDCNGGNFGNLQKDYTVSLSGGNKIFYLDLPLKVSFMLKSGGRLSGNYIRLYKEKTTTENGLQLKITDNNNIPVTFGETSSPDNKFGNFQGGPGGGMWNISNTYNAVLFPTGDPVKTGSYNAQVLVKVEYY